MQNASNIAALVKRCANAKALSEGKHLHDCIIERGLGQDIFLANLLVHMYGKCGALEDARKVFDSMPRRNSFSWNIMVATYAQSGCLTEAIKIFQKIPTPNVVSWNALITAYSLKGLLREAILCFQKMPERDVASWNAIVAAYAQHGLFYEAFQLFYQMPQRDVISWNSVLSIYVQIGQLEQAYDLFQEMPHRNVISWTTMISAFAQHGQMEKANQLFKQMSYPNMVSWTAMVSGYAQVGQLNDALKLFQQMPQRDVVSWTAMVTGYAQHGHMKEAFQLFKQMPCRNIVSWTALIVGYASQGRLKVALELFQQMELEGIVPDKFILVCLLDACSNQAALEAGKKVQAWAEEYGHNWDIDISNSLINMYGKCGSLYDAHELLRNLPQQSLVAWNCVVAAYAQHGHGKEVLQIIHQMRAKGLMPDEITLIGILSACSHAGLIDDCYHWFLSMSVCENMKQTLQHYNCILDVLGRTGWLEVTEAMINNIPFHPDATSWTALLASCMLHGKIKNRKNPVKKFG